MNRPKIPAVRKALKSDRLYARRPTEETVEISNGHWLVRLPANVLLERPDLAGYVPAVGEAKTAIVNSYPDPPVSNTAPKFDGIWKEAETFSVPVEKTKYLIDYDDCAFARKYNGQSITAYFSEEYRQLLADLLGSDGEWYMSEKYGNQKAGAIRVDGELVGCLMPRNVEE